MSRVFNGGFYAFCSECIELRDPHCGWDTLKGSCVSIDTITSKRYVIQDVRYGDVHKCKLQTVDVMMKQIPKIEPSNEIDEKIGNVDLVKNTLLDPIVPSVSIDCNEVDNNDVATGCSSIQNRMGLYTSEYLHIIVTVASLVALAFGFVCGYLVSQRFHSQPQYPNAPFIEQHNHLDR